MGDDLFLCMASCQNANSTGAFVGNDSYDIECITQCSQLHAKLYEHTTEKYTNIFQKIAIVLITFGLIGKVFNCIIFLRKPLRGTSTGLLLLLKTIFDFVPLLWTFVFDTKFFVKDEQINASRILCALSRSSEIFVSWSIGFVILACTIRLATIIHLRFLPKPTRLHVFTLILIMMFCGLVYNWHVFYYPSLVQNTLTDDQNRTFSYCNILFGRQMGYFSYAGFQSTQEFVYNAPIVNFIVSSLIPFAIVASTNLVIIVRVLKNPSSNHLTKMNSYNNGHRKQSSKRTHLTNTNHNQPAKVTTNITKKDVSYETTITLTTSCVFLTTNSIASIYVYVKSSHRSSRSRLTEDIKTSNIYLILRMLTLIDTVLEFYIYFLTGKKFREEVYNVIGEILQQTPLRKFFKFSRSTNTNNPNNRRQQKNLLEKDQEQNHLNNQNHLNLTHSTATATATTTTTMSRDSSYIDTPRRQKMKNSPWHDVEETIDRIESTV